MCLFPKPAYKPDEEPAADDDVVADDGDVSGWSDGWSSGWLAGWLAGWSDGWLDGSRSTSPIGLLYWMTESSELPLPPP